MPDLPEACVNPCNDCPWRRKALPGWLGPFYAEQWVALAHSEEPIACHQTIEVEDDWTQPGLRQCAGAATYRSNVAKRPRNPQVALRPVDRDRVFSGPSEFTEHHNPRST